MSNTASEPASAVRASTDSAYSDAQLLLAARLYYIDGMLQSQIAKMVGVSQAKVSRMLAVARDRGLVRITIPEFDPRHGELETSLCDRFKLRAAVVIRRVPGQTTADVRNTLGYFAAPVCTAWLAQHATVAVAGGRTLQSLTDAMSQQPAPARLVLVQAMGNVDATPGRYDASEIIRRLAASWGSVYLALNTPAPAPSAAVARQLLALKDVKDVFAQLAMADAALVGIGNLTNSVFLERGILKPRDVEALRRAGAVGEILGRFYDVAGRECDTPLRERIISLPLERLRNTPNVVGVVAGSDRSEAILAAIRGKLVKSLVIDDATAHQLMDAAT